MEVYGGVTLNPEVIFNPLPPTFVRQVLFGGHVQKRRCRKTQILRLEMSNVVDPMTR